MSVDVAAIRARLEAASPGPWQVRASGWLTDELDSIIDADGTPVISEQDEQGGPSWSGLPDAEFIAHAPADIAALLAENERLRSAITPRATRPPDVYSFERNEEKMTERTYSNRGFAQHQPIECAYGGEIRVYESSAASAPHIWVNITESKQLADSRGEDERSAAVHLTLDAARELVLDLTDLIENHYQNEGVS